MTIGTTRIADERKMWQTSRTLPSVQLLSWNYIHSVAVNPASDLAPVKGKAVSEFNNGGTEGLRYGSRI